MTETHAKEIKLSGKAGVVALIVVIGILVFQVTTMKDVSDPKVLALIEKELTLEWTRLILPKMKESVEDGSFENLELLQNGEPDTGLIIHRVRASKPLLSFSSNQEVIYEVKYSFKDGEGGTLEGTKYMRIRHSLTSDPFYSRDARKLDFYFNFFKN